MWLVFVTNVFVCIIVRMCTLVFVQSGNPDVVTPHGEVSLVVARKGVVRWCVTVHGKEAHRCAVSVFLV